MLSNCSGLSSLVFVDGVIPVLSQIALAVVGPIPNTYRKEITMCLLSGMLTPAIRAIKGAPFSTNLAYEFGRARINPDVACVLAQICKLLAQNHYA
jgi:hypothetical protein